MSIGILKQQQKSFREEKKIKESEEVGTAKIYLHERNWEENFKFVAALALLLR